MVKIKSKSEPWNLYHNGNEVEEYLKEHILSDEHIIDDDNEIYVRKSGGHIFPLSHPDLSTQPSILHERFGTYRIYEVLIPGVVDGRSITRLHHDQIPASAVIMSAVAFNKNKQSGVNTDRVLDGWECHVVGGFVPDFLLVRYYDTEKDTYYGSSEGYGSGGGSGVDDFVPTAFWGYLTNGSFFLADHDGNFIAITLDSVEYVLKAVGDFSHCEMMATNGHLPNVNNAGVYVEGDYIYITIDGSQYTLTNIENQYIISPTPSTL